MSPASCRLAAIVCVIHGVTVGAAALASAQLPLFGPYGSRIPVRSTDMREEVPRWLELPREARISTGDDLRLTPLHNSAISFETLRIGVLVGALRNDGACATNLTARLQYVDASWQPVGPPIANEARVSQVEPGGILPFRFRLHTIEMAKVPPAAYVIVIEQDHRPIADPFAWNRWVSTRPAVVDRSPCPQRPATLAALVSKRQPLPEGFLLSGTTTIVAGGPVRADAIVLTAVLRDKAQDVLEVLVGTPTVRKKDETDGTIAQGQPLAFRLHTPMPVGREVAHVDVMVELLPDASVAPPAAPPR